MHGGDTKPYILDINSAFDRRTSKWRPANLPMAMQKKKKKSGHGIIHIGHGMQSIIATQPDINEITNHHDICKPYNKTSEFYNSEANTSKEFEEIDFSNGLNTDMLVQDETGDQDSGSLVEPVNTAVRNFESKYIATNSSFRNVDKTTRNSHHENKLQTLHHEEGYHFEKDPKFNESETNLQQNHQKLFVPLLTPTNYQETHPYMGTVILSKPNSPNRNTKLRTNISATEIDRDSNNQGVAESINVHGTGSSTLQVFEENHASKLANFFSQLYNHDQLTDIKINVGNYSFSAHRAILVCFSPYFSELIMNSNQKMEKITLVHGVTPTGFKKTLDYMYTKELTIEVECLAEVLQAACILRINDLQNHCLSIFKKAKLPALLDILETAHKQGVRNICQNLIFKKISTVAFGEISKLAEFNGLCCECLSLILDQDELCVTSEYEIALAVLKWLNHAPDERLRLLDVVFFHVRLENMTSVEIMRLGQDAGFLMENAATRERLMKIQWYKRCLEIGLDTGIDDIVERPRKGVIKPNDIKQTERQSKTTNDKIKQSTDKPPSNNERQRQVIEKNKERHRHLSERSTSNEKQKQMSEKNNASTDKSRQGSEKSTHGNERQRQMADRNSVHNEKSNQDRTNSTHNERPKKKKVPTATLR